MKALAFKSFKNVYLHLKIFKKHFLFLKNVCKIEPRNA